jgi:hypothetical protein
MTNERQIMDDQYNLRLAMLSIIREIRRGAEGGDEGLFPITDATDWDGMPIENYLSIRRGTSENDRRNEIIFEINHDNILTRTGSGTVGENRTPVPFTPVTLKELNVTSTLDGHWLIIELVGHNDIRAKATISLWRIPPSPIP